MSAVLGQGVALVQSCWEVPGIKGFSGASDIQRTHKTCRDLLGTQVIAALQLVHRRLDMLAILVGVTLDHLQGLVA